MNFNDDPNNSFDSINEGAGNLGSDAGDIDEYVDWFHINKKMNDKHDENSRIFIGVLFLIHECRQLLFQIIQTQNDYPNKKLIHDIMVSMLVRSFRHCLAATKVALSGYPDSAYVIVRTLWEIRIRIGILMEEPVEASYGFKINDINDQIKIYKAYTDDEEKVNDYAAKLKEYEDMKNTIEIQIKSSGFNDQREQRIKTLSKLLNYKDETSRIAQRKQTNSIKNEYQQLYAELCVASHGKSGLDYFFIYDDGDVRKVNINPVPDSRMIKRAVANTLEYMTLILLTGAAIVENGVIREGGLFEQCIRIRSNMKQHFHGHQ
jgi:hypothetical protein